MATKKRAKKAPAKSASAKKAKSVPVRKVSKPKPAKKTAPVRRKAGALQMTETAPGFTVNDVETSLAFYQDVLGFVAEERWEREGKLMGVQLRAGAVVFMLGQDDWKKGHDRKKGEGFRLYCTTTQNVDDLARKIEAKGGRLDQQPTDQTPWGMRDFAVTDPDGFKITIAAKLKKKR